MPAVSRPLPGGGAEELYRVAFSLSGEAIIAWDRQRRILQVNPAAVRLFQYGGKEELLALESVRLLFQRREDLDRLEEALTRERTVRELSVHMVRKGGEAFHALLSAEYVKGGPVRSRAVLALIREVSGDGRDGRSANELHRRLDILRTVSTAVSSSLHLNEVLGQTIDRILEILGAASIRIYMLDPKEECLRLVAWKGLSGRFVNKEHFQRRKVGDGLLGKTVLTRKATVVDNYLRADDPYVDCIIEEGLKSSVYIPLLSKEKAVGVMCVSSHAEYRFSPDFVEFLTAIGNQIGVAIENANLYEDLKRAYQELSEAQEQVVRTEKLASLGKLAATIAHEINNPISVVLTYVKLMRKLVDRGRFSTERLADIARYLGTMESETARCGEIVKNLLAFSRHSQGTYEDHSIEEVIERTVSLIAHDLEIKEMSLVKEIAPELPKVRCDFRQMQQAILNLMINAIEAMTKGGTLTVKAGPARKEGFIQISVQDTGCGIQEKDLGSIFEPFFTTKEEAKGVGLGLSVVYGIVTRHGGSIEVQSSPGHGSTFTILLPVAGRPQEEEDPSQGRGEIGQGEQT